MDEVKDDTRDGMIEGKVADQDEPVPLVYDNDLDAENLTTAVPHEVRFNGKSKELDAISNKSDMQDTERSDLNQHTHITPKKENDSLYEKEKVQEPSETPESDETDGQRRVVIHGGESTKGECLEVQPIDCKKDNFATDNGDSRISISDEPTKGKADNDMISVTPQTEHSPTTSTTDNEENQTNMIQKHVNETGRRSQEEMVQNGKHAEAGVDTEHIDSTENNKERLVAETNDAGKSANQENIANSVKNDQEIEQTSKSGGENEIKNEELEQKSVHLPDKDEEEINYCTKLSLEGHGLKPEDEAFEMIEVDQAFKLNRADPEIIRQERDQLRLVMDELRRLIEEDSLRQKKVGQKQKQSKAGSSPCEEVTELRDPHSVINGLRSVLIEKNAKIGEIERHLAKEKRKLEAEIQNSKKEAKEKDGRVQAEIKHNANIKKTLDDLQKKLDGQKKANVELNDKQVQLQVIKKELEKKVQACEKEIRRQRQKIEVQETQGKANRSEIQSMESKIKEQENALKLCKNDNNAMALKINELKKSTNTLLEDRQKLSSDKSILLQHLQKQNDEVLVLEEKIKVLEDTVKSQEEEKSKLNIRLSKLAGAHLTRDNPNIADLSDENRPTKIAEKFSELYDNEWTDAYEELCDTWNLNERASVEEMIRLLKVVDKECSFYSRPHREILDDLQTVTVKLDKLSSKHKTTQTAAIAGCEKESSDPIGDTLDDIERNNRDTEQLDPEKVYSNKIHNNIYEQKDEPNSKELNDNKDILESTGKEDIGSPQTKETAERSQNGNELKDEPDGDVEEDNQTTPTHKRKNDCQEAPIENLIDEYIEGQIKEHAFKKQRCLNESRTESDDKENDEPGLDISNDIEQDEYTQHGKETIVTGKGQIEIRKTDQEMTIDIKEMDEDVILAENAKDRNLDPNPSGILEAEENYERVENAGFKEEGQTEVTRESMFTSEKFVDKENINLDRKRENETGNDIDREIMATVICKREHSRNVNKATSDDKLLDSIEDSDGVGITVSPEKSTKQEEGKTNVEEGTRTNDERHHWDDKWGEVEENLGDEHRLEYGYNEDNDNTERKDIASVNNSADIVENLSLPDKFSTCVDTGEVAAVLKIQVEFTAEQKKTVSDIKKTCTSKLEKSQKISEVIAQKVAFGMNHEYLQNPTVMAFIQKCAELCWFMVMQEPPVVVGFETETEDVKFDKDRYKAYTKTGKKLDFVVWPPLYLHKDGPMLCKGTAQGKD